MTTARVPLKREALTAAAQLGCGKGRRVAAPWRSMLHPKNHHDRVHRFRCESATLEPKIARYSRVPHTPHRLKHLTPTVCTVSAQVFGYERRKSSRCLPWRLSLRRRAVWRYWGCQCGVRHARTPRLRGMGPWVGCGVRRALGVVAERVGVSARAVHGELGWHPNLVRDVVAHVGVVVDVEVVHV